MQAVMDYPKVKSPWTTLKWTTEDRGVRIMGQTTEQAIRGRILVVDDENGPRQALRMLLKEEHDVFLAEDVPAAKRVLETESIDLIITDLRMPKQTGVDLLRWAKVKFPGVEVVILTGYGELDTAMQAVEFGAMAYIEKPFDANVMMRHVHQGLTRRRAEQERQRMEHLALEANRFETLGRFVSGMLHDLGSPLAVISGQLEMMVANPAAPKNPERMKMVQSQTELCTDIVRSAMNFLRHDGHRFTVLNINDIAENCRKVSQALLKKYGAHATFEFAQNVPSCVGDFVLIRQAILNLMTNACQAMEGQGAPRNLFVRTWRENDTICISVEDSGPGIKPEDRTKIFETFYTTKGKSGTGLGLTAVKNVMRKHRGDVVVGESEHGGAAFVLRFPLKSAEEEEIFQ